jgi:hypothetical protein
MAYIIVGRVQIEKGKAMKKFFLNAILVAIGSMAMFSVNTFAANSSEMPGGSVYGSRAEQDAVYEAIQKSEQLMFFLNEYAGVTVLKESITPLYEASLLEYAETGVFTVRLYMPNGNGLKYMAKTVAADGRFAGNIGIIIRDGVAKLNGFTPTPALEHLFEPEYGFGGNAFVVSFSYADHAKRIQRLTNRESFLPVDEVRLVGVEGLGNVFYINDGKTEALVSINAADDVFYNKNREIVYVGRELKKIADGRLAERKAYLAKVAEWQAAHPGEKWDITGDASMPTSAVTDNVDDIVNIKEHLSAAAYEVNSSPSINAATGTTNGLLRTSLIALPLAAVALFISFWLIYKDRKAETTDNR